MAWFESLTIRARLFVGVTVLVLLSALSLGMTYYKSSAARVEMDNLAGRELDSLMALAEMRMLTSTNAALIEAVLAMDDAGQRRSFVATIDKNNGEIDKHVAKLQEWASWGESSQEKQDVLKKLVDVRNAYLDANKQALAMREQGNTPELASHVSQKLGPATGVYLNQLSQLAKFQQTHFNADKEDAESQITGLGTALLLTSGFMIAMTIAMSWLFSRYLNRRIADTAEVARNLATGDLTLDVNFVSNDELGVLEEAVADSVDYLRRMVTEIKQAADSVRTAATEIASGNTDLSARTEQQASNLQQSSSSVEQLTSNVRSNAETAREATELASKASGIAQRGGSAVSEVVQTMEAINGQSKKIAEIVGVVDSIAFQTNILALNAAVEAARAGEQGRGFAVVATEVRNLAQRSAQAAREIKSLIGTSVAQVETGTGQVQQAGATMREIVDAVNRVSQMIEDIARATTEQSSGIAEVNKSVSELDRMTQQNAALVEQSTAAAESLKDQADRLASAVGSFKLTMA